MKEQRFVHGGKVFDVLEEDDGKFVVDVVLRFDHNGGVDDYARVVGRFNSLGDAITAAKGEIEALVQG